MKYRMPNNGRFILISVILSWILLTLLIYSIYTAIINNGGIKEIVEVIWYGR